jgi:hypothetical protein
MFKTKDKQPQPFNLAQFNTELSALVDRAIAARVHLVDVDHSLEDQLTRVRFRHAQRPVV